MSVSGRINERDGVEKIVRLSLVTGMYNVSVGHKYFSTETTKLPAIFHDEVIIIRL